jgi:hypothetical protein
LRRFTKKLAVAVLAVIGGYWAARVATPLVIPEADGPQVSKATPVATELSVPASDSTRSTASGSGDALITEVLNRVEHNRPNVMAKVRQSMRTGHDRFTGEGAYWQQNVGNLRKSRWELKTLIGDDEAFVTQIFDGDYVWTDRRLPGQRNVSRINISRVRRELALNSPQLFPEGQGRGGDELNLEVLARGGISQLVADLNRLFIFGEEQTLRRGERTVRAVLGRWRPAELERQWPGLSTSGADDWPEHLPHHVLVYIDSNDFFPYLVEYRGGDQASLAESAASHFPAPDPLASFEFIDVQFANPVPSELFQFTPAESDWHDETGSIVERLKPAAPKEEEPATARRNGTWR